MEDLDVRAYMDKLKDGNFTARHVMQNLKDEEDCQELPEPAREDGYAPEEPNAYTDASVKNPRISHLQLGGIGIY